MYRIVFNPDTACWMVQLQQYGIFWKSINTTTDGSPGGFPDFAAAKAYVDKVGLENVYRNYNASPVRQMLHTPPNPYRPRVAA